MSERNSRLERETIAGRSTAVIGRTVAVVAAIRLRRLDDPPEWKLDIGTRQRPFQTVERTLIPLRVRTLDPQVVIGVDTVVIVVDFRSIRMRMGRVIFRRRQRIGQGQTSPHALMGR